MKKEPNKKAIGLFLVIGFTLFLGLIGQSVFHKIYADTKDVVVMYFNESSQGLSEGSPIVFQGVEVGKVSRVQLVTDKNNLKFNVAVYARLKHIDIMSEGSIWDKFWKKDNLLGILVANGLRARLATQSYLTGQLMIELVMDAKTPAVLRGTGKYWEIPTELSSFAMLSQDLEEVPLRETLSRLGNIIQDLEENLPQILKNMAQVTQKVDKALDKKSGEASKSMQGFNTAMEEISKTSRSIKNLTDYLERHPEALLMGKEK